MRFKNNRKADVKVRRDNLTIHPLVENTDILEPSQHNKNVRLLRRPNKHIHHHGGGSWWAVVQIFEEEPTNGRAKDSHNHETSCIGR